MVKFSRRDFLKLGTAALSTAVLTSLASPAIPADAASDDGAKASAGAESSKPASLAGRPAEKLILGNIYTLNEDCPTAKAMTVVDGRIQYIGSAQTANALCDNNTEILDYGKNCIYPGFLDAHCHPAAAGERLCNSADLSAGETYEQWADIMKAHVKKYPNRSYYQGSGWKLLKEEPDKSILDAICPGTPMILLSEDGECVWVNSAELKACSIGPDEALKAGSDKIRMDKDGDPTGLIFGDTAKALYSSLKPTSEEQLEALLAWQDYAFSHGYTAVSDAAMETVDLAVYQAALQGQQWLLRTYAFCPLEESVEDPTSFVEQTVAQAEKLNSEYFRIIGFKVDADGDVKSRTAWMNDNYVDQPGFRGEGKFDDATSLSKLVKLADAKGMNVQIHATGDAAAKFAMDAIENAQLTTMNFEQRNALCQLQFVRTEEIQRMADQRVIALMPPIRIPKDFQDQTNVESRYIGGFRTEQAYPVQSYRNCGGTVAFQSDFPNYPVMDIPRSFFCAVERYDVTTGGLTFKRGDAERMSRRDALLAMTKNVACLWHEEDRMGTLEIGKLANMTVFDKDFFTVDIRDVVNARLIATIVDGNEVYQIT